MEVFAGLGDCGGGGEDGVGVSGAFGCCEVGFHSGVMRSERVMGVSDEMLPQSCCIEFTTFLLLCRDSLDQPNYGGTGER